MFQPELVVAAAVTFAVPAVALLGSSAGPTQKSMLNFGAASGMVGSVAPFATAAVAHGLSLLAALAASVVPASALVSMVIAV